MSGKTAKTSTYHYSFIPLFSIITLHLVHSHFVAFMYIMPFIASGICILI